MWLLHYVSFVSILAISESCDFYTTALSALSVTIAVSLVMWLLHCQVFCCLCWQGRTECLVLYPGFSFQILSCSFGENSEGNPGKISLEIHFTWDPFCMRSILHEIHFAWDPFCMRSISHEIHFCKTSSIVWVSARNWRCSTVEWGYTHICMHILIVCLPAKDWKVSTHKVDLCRA